MKAHHLNQPVWRVRVTKEERKFLAAALRCHRQGERPRALLKASVAVIDDVTRQPDPAPAKP
jgi:hypothetical protein